jgi:hypothetical protein
MTEQERELDLMVAELMNENKTLKAQNEMLQAKLERALDDTAKFQTALARILAISDVAFRHSGREAVGEVGTQAREKECND